MQTHSSPIAPSAPTGAMDASAVSSTAEYLSEELRKRVTRNTRYSLRAFAQALELSPGQLSELMRGKRKLTLKGALKIAQKLNLAPEESERFTHLVMREEARRAGAYSESAAVGKRHLTHDFFHLVSDWYCFAILNLAETAGFQFDARAISRRLGITATETKLALECLERIGLIERVDGRLRVTPDFVLSPEGIPSEAVRKYHGQILEKARVALDEQSVSERDIAGITFAIDPKRLPELKKEIHHFLDSWAERLTKLDPHTRTEVYHLESALFRLTRPATEGKKS